LSYDHKPESLIEKERIINSGGSIFLDTRDHNKPINRIIPGGLSVSRTIGDIEAKEPRFRGIPGVIIPIPDILVFNIQPEMDFILLGSII
jgi:protein phosphatase 2C family protein 2/3